MFYRTKFSGTLSGVAYFKLQKSWFSEYSNPPSKSISLVFEKYNEILLQLIYDRKKIAENKNKSFDFIIEETKYPIFQADFPQKYIFYFFKETINGNECKFLVVNHLNDISVKVEIRKNSLIFISSIDSKNFAKSILEQNKTIISHLI